MMQEWVKILLEVLMPGGLFITIITLIMQAVQNKRKNNRQQEQIILTLNHISKGLSIGLQNDIVIFKALREHKINGESEQQEQVMYEYLKDSTDAINSMGWVRK